MPWSNSQQIMTLLVLEASKPMSPERIVAEVMTPESMSPERIVAELVTSEHVASESISSEPMSPTPRMPYPCACQEQHRQHDDDSHPLLPRSHSPSLPRITMSVLDETWALVT
jgi:hypothetical protein